METIQSVPELIAAALVKAKASEKQIAEIKAHLEEKDGSGALTEDLHTAYVALELLAVDTFSVFEARMQHHFKRGPFSRKLKALLVGAGHTDLADRLHQYYLAVNVLKHGTGASYRELRDTPNALFPVKPAEEARSGEEGVPSGLVDVGVPGFFEGLAATLVEAHQFLEAR